MRWRALDNKNNFHNNDINNNKKENKIKDKNEKVLIIIGL